MMTTLLDGRGIDVKRGMMTSQTHVAPTVTTSQSERHAENSMNQSNSNSQRFMLQRQRKSSAVSLHV
jgi:hypothetical protein